LAIVQVKHREVAAIGITPGDVMFRTRVCGLSAFRSASACESVRSSWTPEPSTAIPGNRRAREPVASTSQS
jgi:hypothetical protein